MTTRIHRLLPAALAAVLLVPTPVQAAVAGADGRIVFTSSRDGNLEIYSMAPDGTDQINLTAHPARDQDPAWSPDGTRVAFSSSRDGNHQDIWVMDADGAAPANLTSLPDTSGSGEAGVEPAWSPDGSRIAYSYQGDVWVMDAAGGGKTNLTGSLTGGQPAWSPNGTRIAYVTGADVWVMGADGTGKTQLTATAGGLGVEKAPDWSPDGARIAYERSGGIWRMNADGSGQQAVSAGVGKGGTRPSWSPVGTRIVFSSSAYTAPNGPDIFVANPDGTGVRRLPTVVPAEDLDPQWQPVATTAKQATYTTVQAVAGTQVTVSGELFTAHPGRTMTVTLFAKVGGVFRQVGVAQPTLSAYGRYQTAFADPGASTCKAVARFGGDADHRASQKAKTFAC